MSIKRLIVTLPVLFFGCLIYSQNQQFKHYSVNDGLSQSVVNCIYQDKTGFLWFGTQNGLNKFDGYTFTKYNNDPTDTTSISDNWIYDICEDESGNLLVATKKGINILNKKGRHFTRLKDQNENREVYGLFSNNHKAILINKPSYVLIFHTQTGKIDTIHTKSTFDGLVNDHTIPLLKDSKGNLWQATTNGLYKINIETNEIVVFNTESKTFNLSNNYISALYEDKAGNIWIGTRNGLNILDLKENRLYKYYNSQTPNSLSNNFIRSIVQDNKGTIWIGTEGGGLNKSVNKDIKELSFLSFRHNPNNLNTLSHDIVLSLYIDNSNILWIGTLQGIDKVDLKDKKFRILRKTNDIGSTDLLDNVIASIYKENESSLWIGNWGKGLNLVNRKTNKVRHFSSNHSGKNYIPNDFVHVLFEAPDKTLWIGTRDGIAVFNRESDRFINIDDFYKNNALPNFSNNRVFSIISDKEENIWVATQNGLFSIHLKKNTTRFFSSDKNSEPRVSSNMIYKLLEDKNGNIWIATLSGLDKYNLRTGKMTSYKHNADHPNTLCDNYTISLCEDLSGDIWIGTQSGLNRFSQADSTFTYFSEKDGLPSLVIYNIVKDINNNLWFTTGNGLAQYNHKTKKFKTYDLDDGLQSLEFNLNAVYQSKDGELFLGGMNGINYFYPDSLKENKFIPPVVISKAEIINNNGKHEADLSALDEIILNHDDLTLTIEFSALDYTNPVKNQYAYMIEGQNQNWINIENRRFVSFTNLAEGRHSLRIKGANNDGVWNEKGITLIIVKKPPWWRTSIAFFIYILLIITGVFVLVKMREQKLRKEKRILEERVAFRTKEISRQKEEILAQRDEIQAQMELVSEQRNKISQQNTALTDSILYAKRIQTAVLPTEKLLNELFPNYFTLFLPRDIVSGDFYWAKKVHVNSVPYIYFTVADCTGHGVPGGFVSMLSITLLNEIVRDEKDYTPANVLNQLRELVKSSLGQNEDEKELKDGLDMSLCLYKPETKELHFAGANSFIYHIQNNELNIIKGDSMPVATYFRENPFTNHVVQIESGDTFYLFTDGYLDQFGGEKNQKFMRRNFKELIISIQKQPFEKHKDVLYQTLSDWKKGQSQIDDITVMGIKFIDN